MLLQGPKLIRVGDDVDRVDPRADNGEADDRYGLGYSARQRARNTVHEHRVSEAGESWSSGQNMARNGFGPRHRSERWLIATDIGTEHHVLVQDR